MNQIITFFIKSAFVIPAARNWIIRFTFLALVLCLSGTKILFGVMVKVNSVSSLQTAINKAKAGDEIIVANGVYVTSESILISVKGTASNPITVAAESIGGVEIKGTHGFVVSSPASYIIIKGFKFTHKAGTAYIEAGATHCIITRNVFECAAVNSGDKSYFTVSGDDNEISYNTFQNKMDVGKMLSVQGPGSNKMAKRTWIHHNYFYNFPPKANNCSAIQIGLSTRSMDSAFCIVEYNLFIKTAGENEGCICHKSCRNIIRFNTFGEGSEEVSVRHGNGSEVYGNFFMGNTGLRFSGDDHKIYSNFFKGCPNAIVCTNGDGEVAEGSKLTCHDRADRVQIVYNTIVDCASGYQVPSRNSGLGATSITFANNILMGCSEVSIRGKYVNPVWKGNILWNTKPGAIPAGGFTVADPKLEAGADGVYHLGLNSLAIAAGTGSYPFVTIDIDGQSRGNKPDTGADQFASVPTTNRVLTTADVGPLSSLK